MQETNQQQTVDGDGRKTGNSLSENNPDLILRLNWILTIVCLDPGSSEGIPLPGRKMGKAWIHYAALKMILLPANRPTGELELIFRLVNPQKTIE